MKNLTPRHWKLGFSLIDLVVTVTLLVTLAGIGGFYYQEFRETQKSGVAANELDTYAKAVAAYELTTGVPVSEAFIASYRVRGFPELQFLVDAGSIPFLTVDPWGRNYELDTARGVVRSKGPLEADPADDLEQAYKKDVARVEASPVLGIDDREPPTIDTMSPCGTIRNAAEPVRITYFDNVGGCILADKTHLKLFVDGKEINEDTVTDSIVNRSSSQTVFTTPGGFSEGEHVLVAQVEDCYGNISRRQCKFIVDTASLTVKWKDPEQEQVRGVVPITAVIYNGGLDIDGWDLTLDFGKIASSSDGSGKKRVSDDESSPITLYAAFDTTVQAGGSHNLTLSVRKKSGQVEEFRRLISFDNEKPVIAEIIDDEPPPPGDCQRISTTTPDIGGRAVDNSRIKNVTYQYFRIDSETRQRTSAVMSAPATAIPPAWSPGVNPNHESDNPGALFLTAEERFFTLPHAKSDPPFQPVTLPQGYYEVEFVATDLAGNQSDPDTVCFVIDLRTGGLADARFADYDTNPCSTVSEDRRHIHGLNAPSFSPSFETSGRVQFTILEAGVTPVSTWTVIIDDNGPGGVPDGKYLTSAPRDWVASGSFQGQPKNTKYETPAYVVDDAAERDRRGGGSTAGDALELVYTARIGYQSDTGASYTTFTTFLVDNTLPGEVGSAGFLVQQPGTLQQIDPEQVLLSLSDSQNTGSLRFGGQVADRPTTGVIRQVAWSLRKISGAPAEPANQNLIVNAQVFPALGTPCTSNTVRFGAAVGQSNMQISTTIPGGLDGSYEIVFSVVDGAGLTTRPARLFSVDTLPPEVQSIKFFEQGGVNDGLFAEVPCSVGLSRFTTLEGQTLRFKPVVQDQFAIREVHYWLVPVTDPPTTKGAPVVVQLVGDSTSPDVPEQVVLRDIRNAPIQPLPQQYRLEVEAVGKNRTDPGPLCVTNVSFQFVSNLAIFAPLDADSSRVQALDAATLSASRTWLSSAEQRDLASYLLAAFPAGSARVFDFSGRSGRSADSLDISDWLSQNATSGSSDVLVILDAAPAGALTASGGSTPPLKLFLEGDGLESDGNVVVWVGPEPFTRQVREDQSTGDPAVTTAAADASQAAIFGADLGIRFSTSSALQVHSPQGRPMDFLPSLYPYAPFSEFIGFGTGSPPNVWLQNGAHAAGEGAGGWVLERLFTEQDGSASPARGNAFVYRRTASGARFATFYAFGPTSPLAERNPVPPLPYVIEEFLTNYLVSPEDPSATVKRVAFSNSSTSLAPVSPSGTSSPRDVIRFPDSAGGFENVTTNTASAQTAELVELSDDGAEATFLSPDRSKEGGSAFSAPAASLFARDVTGKVRLLAKALDSTAPITQASRARRGGTAAVATRSNLTNPGAADPTLDRLTIFRVDGASGGSSALTTGGTAAGDSGDPSVSAGGEAIAFTSTHIYDTADGSVPTAFSGLKALSGGVGIFLHRFARGGDEVYRDGWVTKSFGESPICDAPRVAAAGSIVVFQARGVTYGGTLNGRDQIYLASRNTTDTSTGALPWLIGAITQDSSFDSSAPDVAEGAVADGPFPPVVFVSDADFTGRAPNVAGVTDPSAAAGATGAGALAHKAVWLFTGDFGAELVLVARGSDADCLNPRISPDGREVVFESRAATVTGRVAVGPPSTLEHSISNASNSPARNRIYRARVRYRPSIQGELPFSSILERITPDAIDVGSPGQQRISR